MTSTSPSQVGRLIQSPADSVNASVRPVQGCTPLSEMTTLPHPHLSIQLIVLRVRCQTVTKVQSDGRGKSLRERNM
eukprot:1962620-Amphidinium_carterae.1